MKFYSSKKIEEFIQIFSVYEGKYININTLFTTLLIIGSELISSEKFFEQISLYLQNKEESKNNNNGNNSHVLLSLDDFMKINFWFEKDNYLNELSDYSEQKNLQGKYDPYYSINHVNNGIKNKFKVGDFVLNFVKRKLSEIKKYSLKSEKKDKISKIKETIFDINKNREGFIDINILGELLDLSNNYCNKKQKENEINKKDKGEIDVDIDDNDKCFRFSSDDLDEFIYMKKQLNNKKKESTINHVVNNIFNNIFEK